MEHPHNMYYYALDPVFNILRHTSLVVTYFCLMYIYEVLTVVIGLYQ